MKKLLSFIFIFLSSFSLYGKETHRNGFAIFVDQQSFDHAEKEINAYADSVEKDGLKTFIVIDKWKEPTAIRNKLIELSKDKNHPIEGAVFIGDIPIPMTRNAQHLTTAFKMDQERFPWNESSVPSDRFYDDFDLQFDFLKQDSEHKNYFYYSLKANSPQEIHCNIYTARIRPFESDHKYEDLKSYLRKVVRVKSEENPLDRVLFFAGHGYNSESMTARMDEKISLLDQFPMLKQQQQGLSYIDHSMEVHIKDKLLSELQRNSLDIAILHHHGGENKQYLSGMPKVDGVSQQIDGIQRYLRSKLRAAQKKGKDLEQEKKYFSDKWGIPETWFEGSLDSQIIEKDEEFSDAMDIVTDDVLQTSPDARFIVLDACFNGSFHLDKYLSGAYVFNTGSTIAVQANSVNVLQDKWSNELIGLLGIGVRIGNWHKEIAPLESHLIGDPTFHFSAKDEAFLRELNKANTSEQWKTLLDSKYADVQALALKKLVESKIPNMSSLLLERFKNSPYSSVRMECLKLLSHINDPQFIECLKYASTDSSELIRRKTAKMIGKSGNKQLLETLVSMAVKNNTADRVEFTLKQSLGLYPENEVAETFDRIFDEKTDYIAPEKTKAFILKALTYNSKRWEEIPQTILNPDSSEKEKKFSIRLLRNNNYHPGVESFCRFAKETKNEKLQIMMLEALGWFNLSYKKNTIIETCDSILQDTSISPKVRQEAIRTKNRLKS